MATGLVKKLLLRLDGAADSERREFTSHGGSRWQAELCLHSGENPQSPRLMILFRNLEDPLQPQRYNLAPPKTSKIPKVAARELNDEELRELLATSVKV